jgi:hypothetical protein
MVGLHVNLHYAIKTSDWTCLSMPTIRCFGGCSALSKVQELDFQCMCADLWPISLSCHMTFNTHYIYIYSQILTSNGSPHIHVFSQVDMLLTRWEENPLQPTGHRVGLSTERDWTVQNSTCVAALLVPIQYQWIHIFFGTRLHKG